MITFFTAPKPFHGHINIIQRNAILSWLKLSPESEVILFGDEMGTEEIAKEFNLKFIPDVMKNDVGTPLLNDIFEKAQKASSNDLLCYVNADIMFVNDFIGALKVVSEWRKNNFFLLVGRRWNLDLCELWDFEKKDWEELKSLVSKEGKLYIKKAIDYFIFPRGLIKSMPPLAIGRIGWDNWMIYYARSIGVPVIDGTEDITAIHQNHDYSHLSNGFNEFRKGYEAIRNLELIGKGRYYGLDDVTYILRRGKVKKVPRNVLLYREIKLFQMQRPWMRIPFKNKVKRLIRSLK